MAIFFVIEVTCFIWFCDQIQIGRTVDEKKLHIAVWLLKWRSNQSKAQRLARLVCLSALSEGIKNRSVLYWNLRIVHGLLCIRNSFGKGNKRPVRIRKYITGPYSLSYKQNTFQEFGIYPIFLLIKNEMWGSGLFLIHLIKSRR